MEVEHGEEKSKDLLETTKNDVKEGLRLDEGLPDFPEEIREGMVTAIAETLVETAEVLKVPLPEVSLAYQWNDKEAEKRYKEEDKATQRMKVRRTGDDKTNELLIFFYAPYYLRSVAEGMKSRKPFRKKFEENHLRLQTAHEMYHSRAAEKFPYVQAREISKYHEGGKLKKDEWFKSRLEYAAELFAYRYLKSREIKGWKEKVSKSLALCDRLLRMATIEKEREKEQEGLK